MIQCAHCFRWTERDKAFCPGCGEALAHDQPQPVSTWMPAKDTVPMPGARASSAAEADLEEGIVVADRYKILRLVGKGGMGQVYKAHDATLERIVALKFLSQKYTASPTMADRFKREVGLAQEVTDRHVCRVHDIGEHSERLFFSMEYAEGGSLFDLLLEQGPVPEKQALKVAQQLSAGLAALHRHEILHRDLKPGNVLFGRDDDLKISDFGLAAIVDDLPETSKAQGTLCYMAPEQLAAGPLSYQSDIYSLGLVFYEMFTGRRALIGGMPKHIQRQQKEGPPPPSTIHATLDSALEDLIMRCLALHPENRPPSAQDVFKALRAIDATSEAIDISVTQGLRLPRYQKSTHYRARQPFVSGRVVFGEDCLDRETELTMLFSRLNQGESSAIVGPRKSGKSSLLQRVKEEKIRRMYLGEQDSQYCFHRIDLHTVTTDYSPAHFWRECLGRLREETSLAGDLEAMGQGTPLQHGIEDVFEVLRKRNRRFVLLLDEFEQLLHHPLFGSGSRFFALLRSLVINSGSLILVVASRLSVGDLNRTGPSAEDGSPYFNYLIDVRLRSFDNQTIETLLDRAGDAFSKRRRALIQTVAGRQPFLLQGLCWTWFAHGDKPPEVEPLELFYSHFSDYFDHLWSWEGLTDRLRTVLILLSFGEWIGASEKSNIDHEELLSSETGLAYELRKLRNIGMAEPWSATLGISEPHGLTWDGETWTAGSEVFLWWVWDVALTGRRSVQPYQDWIDRHGYEFFFTPEEWESLVARARKSVSVFDSVESLISRLLANNSME